MFDLPSPPSPTHPLSPVDILRWSGIPHQIVLSFFPFPFFSSTLHSLIPCSGSLWVDDSTPVTGMFEFTGSDELVLELDMDASPRTLHFFKGAVQQKGFVRVKIDSVRFAVSPHPHPSHSSPSPIHSQVSIVRSGCWIEMHSLTRVQAKTSRPMAGEEGIDW